MPFRASFSFSPVLFSCLALGCSAPSSSDGAALDVHSPSAAPTAPPSGGADAPPLEPSPPTGTSTGTPGPTCAPRALAKISALAKQPSDPCAAWSNRVRGRIGRAGAGSFAIWTTRTPSSLALVVGALHTLRVPEAPGVASPQYLAAPDPEGGLLRLWVPPADGSFDALLRAPSFQFFRPSLPANENTKTFSTIRPRNDFHVDVMDAQRIEDDGLLEPMPGTLQTGFVPVYDPDATLAVAPTYGTPSPNDVVAYAGHPRTGPLAGEAAIAFGRVLTDAEAESAITALSSAGDEEGTVSYDKEAELVIAGEGFAGMSGGGVFDSSGRLVGTVVRASLVPVNGSKYVRAVRTAFIAKSLASAAKGAQGKTGLTDYLPKP